MDQKPRDDLPPTRDDPLTDGLGNPRNRTSWDRVTREEGDWNFLPLLLVAAIIAAGGWILFASDRAETPGPRTTENTTTTGPARPGPNMNAAPQTTPPRQRLRHQPLSHNKRMLLSSHSTPLRRGFSLYEDASDSVVAPTQREAAKPSHCEVLTGRASTYGGGSAPLANPTSMRG